MKRKWLLAALLVILCVMPLSAGALDMERDGKYIILPEQDRMRLYFRNVDTWTFVTPDNYLEHMDLLLARGDREEDVHARFAEDSMVFEAYSDQLHRDACIRL